MTRLHALQSFLQPSLRGRVQTRHNTPNNTQYLISTSYWVYTFCSR